MKTETQVDGSQSSNQSRSRDMKPNCYECKYRGCADFSAHSTCNHPRVKDALSKVLALYVLSHGIRADAVADMNISYNRHGFKNGWFMWPINFDPVWLETCDGFTEVKDEAD